MTTSADASRPPVEAEVAVGGAGAVVGVVMGAEVVPAAEQGAVGEVGAPAAGPGVAGVVGFAPGRRHRAALGPALGVGQGEGLALGGAEQPAGAAEVEDLGGAAEDGRDDAGGAGQAAYLAGGQGGAVGNSPTPVPACSPTSGMVTTTWVAVPPWAGSRAGSTASSSEQNAMPGPGRAGAGARWRGPAATHPDGPGRRRGAVR